MEYKARGPISMPSAPPCTNVSTGENPPDAIDRVIDDHLKKISEFGITIPPQEEAALL